MIRVTGLSATAGGRTLLAAIDFEVHPGRMTALVGPSGSGKTTAALALLGEAGPGVRLAGTVVAGGIVVVDEGGPTPEAAAVRGRVVAYLPQHPGSALNPARRIGAGLSELAKLHGGDVATAVQAAQLSPSVLRRFPHQFSGGQRQRIALAQALVCRPDVLVLDEPSTGLDSVTRLQLVANLQELLDDGLGILLLSHDHDLVRALADQVVVLPAGAPGRVLPNRPRRQPWPAPPAGKPLLTATNLSARVRRTEILHDVDLVLSAGGRLGVVGQSGSGKTTLARCLAGLHEQYTGRIVLDDSTLPVLRRRTREQNRRVQYVWQEVRGSFDDRRPVHVQVARTAERLRGSSRADATAEAIDLLHRLGIAETTATRRPTALSGGELQRAALARALLAEPDVLICDEITTSLDEHSADLVLDLLRGLDLALIWIGHDLGLVGTVADQVLVLENGRVVESGSAERITTEPHSMAAKRLVRAARLGQPPEVNTPPADEVRR